MMTEAPPHSATERADRPGRRRPFSSLMKKLASLKASSTGDGNRLTSPKAGKNRASPKSFPSKHNNPYPQSGRIGIIESSRPSVSTAESAITSATTAGDHGSQWSSIDDNGRSPPTARSMAPTISTEHETSRSLATASHGASSLAGTSRTANGGMESRRGGDSTFSSPAPSVRSLTTTLTTIQSMAPNPSSNTNPIIGSQPHHGSPNHAQHVNLSSSQAIHFNQPFPTGSSPASAIPHHLTPMATSTTINHPTTYSSATANSLLTDNASILTLASSSKRRRRRSLDTDASVRALAPSSLWGGSRESLPLSILSATINDAGVGPPVTPGLHGPRPGMNERTSIYSTTGILAAASERNSFYARQSTAPGDAASVRSGLLGHGRADSISGSIGGMAPASLVSPKEMEGEDEDANVHRSERNPGDEDAKET